MGVQFTRSRFEAYAMSQVDSSVGPAGTLEISIGGRSGPAGWRALIGWREARRSLGNAQAYADEVTSGALVAARAEW